MSFWYTSDIVANVSSFVIQLHSAFFFSHITGDSNKLLGSFPFQFFHVSQEESDPKVC